MIKCLQWILRLRDIMRDLNKENIRAFAAQSAYFLMMSAIPLLMLVVSVVQLFLKNGDLGLYISDWPITILPESMETLLHSIMDEVYANSAAVVSVSALAALWAASKGITAITQGLNQVYDVEESRNYLLQRMRGVFYVILLLVCIAFSIFVLVFGNRLAEYILILFPFLEPILNRILDNRIIVIFSMLLIVFLALYKFLPNRKSKWKYQLPGALFSTAGWMFYSFGFSVYVDYFSGFSKMYGSMTTIILLMLWLYWCMYIVLLGGKINFFYENGFPWSSSGC